MEKSSTHPKLLNFTLDILSPYLTAGFRFCEDREDNKEVSYVLQNMESPHAMTDAKHRTVSVVQMKNGYWMGLGFSYYKKKNNRKQLKQFGIQVFDESNPLFRVDWTSSEIEESKNHAQPHWHFDTDIMVKRNEETFSIHTFQQYLKMSDMQDETVKASLGRFHFFMNWNMDKEKDKDAPYLDLSDESLFKPWLTNTLEYIDSELQFIVKR